MLEKEIQLTICDYLALKKYLFWRQNTSPIFDTKTNFYRPMPKYSLTGLPDIIVIKDGKFIGIEVKRPKGKLSLNQEEFKARCEKEKALYIVAFSVDDVIKAGL